MTDPATQRPAPLAVGDFDEWIRQLDEDVIQGEFGYEPGEFTVYTTHWRPLFDEGISPREAWQRALDGHRNARQHEDAERAANYARIVAEDEALIARTRLSALGVKPE